MSKFLPSCLILAAAGIALTLGCGSAGSTEPAAAKSDGPSPNEILANHKSALRTSQPEDPPTIYNRRDPNIRLVALVAPKPLPKKLAALVRLGAKYDTDSDGSVIEITYQKKAVTKEAWAAFQEFPNLEILDLDDTKLKDDALKNVQGFKKLRILSLQKNPITDAGLKHISGLTTLENLALANSKVTGKGLEHIKGLTKLQTLNLSFCNIGDEGLKFLVKMEDLETLALQKSAVTGPGLEHVGKLKNMITLTLNDSNIKGDSLLHLKGLSKLRIINMYDCKVSQTSINKLENEISSLAIFR